MKNFNDKELNRILSEADQLLSDIHLYETPEEEQRRKQKEEEARQQEELKRLAEEEKQRELERQEQIQQEELKRLAEEEKQKELEKQEQIQQEELKRLAEEEQQRELEKQKQIQQEELKRLAEEEQQRELERQEQLQQEKSEGLATNEYQENQEILPIDMEEMETGSTFFQVLFFVSSFIYMELLTHLSLYRSMDSTILYPILWAVGLGCLSALIVSLFPRKVNWILVGIFLGLGGLFCDLQIFCHNVTGSFFNLTAISESIQEISQTDGIAQILFSAMPWLIVMFVPVILWTFLGRKYLRFEKGNWRNQLILLFAGVICMALMVLCLDVHGYEADSPYVCFYQFDSTKNLEVAGKQLGMGTLTVLELLECLH